MNIKTTPDLVPIHAESLTPPTYIYQQIDWRLILEVLAELN